MQPVAPTITYENDGIDVPAERLQLKLSRKLRSELKK